MKFDETFYTMKLLLIFIQIVAASFLLSDELSGRWESKPSPKGSVTTVVFKSGNRFEGFVNKKPFVSGTYTYVDSVFHFSDNGCNGVAGDYRIIFYNNADSMRFETIQDSCTERMHGMERLRLGKVK